VFHSYRQDALKSVLDVLDVPAIDMDNGRRFKQTLEIVLDSSSPLRRQTWNIHYHYHYYHYYHHHLFLASSMKPPATKIIYLVTSLMISLVQVHTLNPLGFGNLATDTFKRKVRRSHCFVFGLSCIGPTQAIWKSASDGEEKDHGRLSFSSLTTLDHSDEVERVSGPQPVPTLGDQRGIVIAKVPPYKDRDPSGGIGWVR